MIKKENKYMFYSISDRGRTTLEIVKIYDMLNKHGFRVKITDGLMELFKITDKFIEQVYPVDLKNFLKDYLLSPESPMHKGKNVNYDEACEIWEVCTKYRLLRIFNEDNFINLTPLNVVTHKHTSTQAYFYFLNCYVEITASGVKKHDYKKLSGYVYKKHVIQNNFDLVPNLEADGVPAYFPGGWSFYDFLKKISQKKYYDNDLKQEVIQYDAEKFEYLQKLIGFTIHDYKQQGDTDFAPFFCDDEIGGSGKGILIQAIAMLTETCTINARKAVIKFDAINMTKATRLKVYTDISKHFQFDQAYTEITDFGSIEHKNGHQEIIPYKDSYKVVFTGNFTMRGSVGADRRRQRVFDVFPFFNENKLPKDFYNGINFFSDKWTPEDWNFFFSSMFQCCSLWLKSNYRISFNNEDYKVRQMEDTYPQEFRDYINLLAGGWHSTGELYDNFKKSGTSPFAKKINSNSFGRMVSNYLSESKIPFSKNSDRSQIFINKDEAQKDVIVKNDNDKTDLPF